MLVTLDRGEAEAIKQGIDRMDTRHIRDELHDLDHIPILRHMLAQVAIPSSNPG